MHLQFAQQKTESLPSAVATPPRNGGSPRVLLAGKITGMAAPGWKEAHMLGLARATAGGGSGGAAVAPLGGFAGRGRLSARLRQSAGALAGGRGRPAAASARGAFDDGLARRQRRPGAVSAGEGGIGGLRRLLGWTARSPWPSWRRRLYQSVDLLLPHTHAEAQQLLNYFRVPAPRVHIIPGAADPQLAAADPEPFAQLVGGRNFVLYLGPIEPRGNQLGFLWAMRASDVPVVVLGDVSPGYPWYLEECRHAAGPRVQFVQNLRRDDPLLASAYAACGCVVLGSWQESSCCAALEAGMSGTPLVLPEGSCAGEYFGRAAFYVNPRDLPGIRRAVSAALARGRSPSLAGHVQTYFSWNAVAKATRAAYDSMLSRR